MKNARKWGFAWALAALQAVAWAQASVEHGQTLRGEPFLAGGIGQEEVAAMRLARPGYGLSVITAARGTGAYVSDVHLRILDGEGQLVFDRVVPGPWLLVALPPGRYALEASRGGEVHKATVTVAAGATREQTFLFEVPEVPPDPVRFPPATQ
jgi:hypothetical protein